MKSKQEDPDENLSKIESLLDHIPYTKSINISDDKFIKIVLEYFSNKNSIVPEIGAVLTSEDLFKFLFVFAGQTITIPDQKTMLTAFRDIDIYFTLKDNFSTTEISKLSTKYTITIQNVRVIFDKVSGIFNKLPH